MTFAYHSILFFILWLKESSFHRFFMVFLIFADEAVRRKSRLENADIRWPPN
jgi:hypothetical protein